ncbi:MAG TPA: phosphoglycerate kinase [candidate division Zixibacteria bacterium]|nr:phosphoglycerate kinase [candidate division Zixibacteria bacterium]
MITIENFKERLARIYENDPSLNKISLEEALAPVPRIDRLQLPRGSRVIIRCDLDVPLEDHRVADSARLGAIGRSVKYAADQGWIPILIGHLGRDPELTLAPVAEALGDILGLHVEFIEDWIDADNFELLGSFREKIAKFAPGQVVMLENTRRYDVERVMWKLPAEDFDKTVVELYALARDIYENVATTVINECLAASNFDFSSSVLPLVMEQTAYGFYICEELTEHVKEARTSQLVIFSGLKIDKLGDLERVIERGKVKIIMSAGSLAMALKKAQAQLAGGDFSLGLAEEDESAKYYIEPGRIEQAKRMLKTCAKQNIEILLPVDFVLNDGSIAEQIPSGKSQMDVGPKTRELFANKLAEFARTIDKPALFYNGVFGKFEDAKFAEGTKAFIAELKKATAAGVQTYVGGGEGRMALIKYGSLDDVTHAFVAGGTILKSLGNKHIAYVKANYLQSQGVKTGATVA